MSFNLNDISDYYNVRKVYIILYGLLIPTMFIIMLYETCTNDNKQATIEYIRSESFNFTVESWNSNPHGDRRPHAVGVDAKGVTKEYQIDDFWNIRDSILVGDKLVKDSGETELKVIRNGTVHHLPIEPYLQD